MIVTVTFPVGSAVSQTLYSPFRPSGPLTVCARKLPSTEPSNVSVITSLVFDTLSYPPPLALCWIAQSSSFRPALVSAFSRTVCAVLQFEVVNVSVFWLPLATGSVSTVHVPVLGHSTPSPMVTVTLAEGRVVSLTL